MSVRAWLDDDDVRGHIETIAVSLSLVGVGAGLGIIWSYAALTQTAAQPPAPWISEFTAQLRSFIWLATSAFVAGSAVVFALLFTDEDYRSESDSDAASADEQDMQTDGGNTEADPPPSKRWGGTLQDRLRQR